MYLGPLNMILPLFLWFKVKVTHNGQVNLTFFAVLTENQVFLRLRFSTSVYIHFLKKSLLQQKTDLYPQNGPKWFIRQSITQLVLAQLLHTIAFFNANGLQICAIIMIFRKNVYKGLSRSAISKIHDFRSKQQKRSSLPGCCELLWL